MVNIIVHGHDPSLSEMIVFYAQDPEMIALAKENGAKVILITHYDDAPGVALADVVLLCGAKESPLDSGSMPVKLAVLFVANVLVLRYTLDNQELANLSLTRTSHALANKLL